MIVLAGKGLYEMRRTNNETYAKEGLKISSLVLLVVRGDTIRTVSGTVAS